ncbi:putative POM121-like protein 1-like isoform X2 [Homo sapiens]|uniref:putative POM121-like protein 1-like isoform X2 n=1 Tax=Homo sapiens TaxID=9606 RepID=UPI0023DF5200|nr:putative POM121-like protein 1-like isoform X2 [Homo sapiens]
MPEQDKDPRVQENPDDQRTVPEVTGDARSAFWPLRDNGGPSPFVPRPGPLQTDHHAQSSEIRYNHTSQTSWTSSSTKRNAISSSYSSTGGLPGLKQRRGPASSRCQLTLSYSKTVSEDRPQAVSSGHTRCEKGADTAPGQTIAPTGGSPRSQDSRPRRRKIPLLPRRRGEPLMLPHPLELGYRVTAEDLHLEKEKAFQRINSALHVEDKAISDCRPSRPSHTLSSLATGASGGPPVSKAPTMDAQQDRPKSQDCLGLVAPLASAAEVPATAPVSGKKHRPPGPLFSSSDPLSANSSHSRDSAQVTSMIPAPFTAASRDAGMRRTRSAPAAAAAAPPPSTLNPTSGSLLNAVDGGPSHFLASATAAARVQRSEVRYNQRSQTSRTRSCLKRNASSSSHSSTEGLPQLKRRRGPASSHCQLAHSSSNTVSEDGPQAVSSGHRCENKAGTAPGQTLAPRGGSPRSQASRPHINTALYVEDKAISDCRPSRPSHTLSSLATGASGGPPVSKAPTMDAQQDRPKSQDCLGLVAPLASAAEVPSTAPVSGKKHRPPGPLFSSSDPLPATSSHSRDSAQVTSLIPATFTAASRDAGMRRTRPGTSAPAAAAAAPPPSTLNPTSGSLLNAVDGGPAHFLASATAAARVERSEVRYNQRSQTSRTRSCLKRNASSSSHSSTEGLHEVKRRRGPASSHCQLAHSSSVSEDEPQAVSSGHPCENKAGTAPGQTLAPRGGSPRSQASRPRINSALHVEDKAISDCRPSRPSHTLSSLATGASGGPPVSKAPTMHAQQHRPKSQDCLGLLAPLASTAEVPSTAPVSGKKHRPPGPLFSSSDPLPATSYHSRDSAQVTSLIPAPFTAASSDAGMRRTRPGTSAPAAAAAAPPPSTLNPTSGSLLNAVDGGPSHFLASATAAARVQRSEVRYNQRSQTSRTRSCLQGNASSSSHSSTEGLPQLKRRRGPASSHCQLAHSSSNTVSEDGPQAVSSGHTRCEKKAGTAPGQTLAPRGGSPRSQASRPRINSALHVEDKAISDCRPSRPSHTLSSLATGASGGPPVSKAPTMDAQQDRPKSQDCLGLLAPLASAAEVSSTAPVSGKKHRPPGPLFSSSDPLPATSSHSGDSAQDTSLIPAPFTPASRDAGIRRMFRVRNCLRGLGLFLLVFSFFFLLTWASFSF